MLADISDAYGQDGRYYRFGVKDNFPNVICEYVNNSGTSRLCISRLNQFLIGKGTRAKEFMDNHANPWETWGDLLDQIAEQVNRFEGFAIKVLFDNAGRPARYYKVDIQHIRKRYDGHFIYNPSLGDPAGYNLHRRYNNIIIPPFRAAINEQEEAQLAGRRRELVKRQLNDYGEQYGELLYVYRPGVGLNYDKYPVPAYASGLNDIAADAGLSIHEESAVSNSFKAGVIIATKPMDRVHKDEDEKTEYDHFEESMSKFTAPDGSPVLHIETDLGDGETPQVTPLNIQHQMDATEQATDRIGRKVCRLFGVPPVLIGFDTAGKLGDNQEIVNKLKLLNLVLEEKRSLIYRGLKKLFPNMPLSAIELEQLDLFDYIPPDVVKMMTLGQLTEAYNLPEDTGAAASDTVDPNAPEEVDEDINAADDPERIQNITKDLTGRQRQQLRSIATKFGQERITLAQAKIEMRGFGLTNDEIDEYLGLNEEEDEFAG